MKSSIANVIEKCSFLRAKALQAVALITAVFNRVSNARLLQNYLCAEPLINIERSLSQVPVGSHLISPRRFYVHHGIYLGGGCVAHYAGYSSSIKPGPIEVTDLDSFASGKPVWVLREHCEYSSDEIVSRARSRVGERHYRIFSNNCEHFCSWCTRGKSYSTQVDALLRSPRGFFSLISALQPRFIA
ncbi:lecithin retinol acyltransferase family protein [Pseudomonas sp. Sample_10]|uniref:lecithin retinol acyltransferase family protein n=1 Tax=Pseudomonas sp. Sample_10 TaxID=2448269 RepID=UPI0010367D1F|nr:lecithin retinol acyltransferase family protein [Pseudomonas sp. Sample_10]